MKKRKLKHKFIISGTYKSRLVTACNTKKEVDDAINFTKTWNGVTCKKCLKSKNVWR